MDLITRKLSIVYNYYYYNIINKYNYKMKENQNYRFYIIKNYHVHYIIILKFSNARAIPSVFAIHKTEAEVNAPESAADIK